MSVDVWQGPSPESEKLLAKLRDTIQQTIPKMKFGKKIWLCLNFTKMYPDTTPIIGLHWIDDTHFLSNSRVLGTFLGTTRNTVNYNFRTHDFDRTPVKKAVLKKYVPSEHSVKNWGVMRHRGDMFNQNLTGDDVNELPWKNPRRQCDCEEEMENEEPHSDAGEPDAKKSSFEFNIEDEEMWNYFNLE